jgi:hypothetical protein
MSPPKRIKMSMERYQKLEYKYLVGSMDCGEQNEHLQTHIFAVFFNGKDTRSRHYGSFASCLIANVSGIHNSIGVRV